MKKEKKSLRCPIDHQSFVGYLDVLNYTKRTAWLKLSKKSDKQFEFSEIWVEPLRTLWGSKVRCVIGNDWQLKKITRASKSITTQERQKENNENGRGSDLRR